MSGAPQPKCLILDVESIPQSQGRDKLTHIGLLRPDLGLSDERQWPKNLKEVAAICERFSEHASFLLGHNIIAHDLPLLKSYQKDLSLYKLPVLDTLLLSPLAFPQNPYHRLIKNYKIISDGLNSPLADCRATLTLFHEQREAFTQLQDHNEQELLCYQSLLAGSKESDLWAYFLALTKRPPLPINQLPPLIMSLLQETDPSLQRNLKVCKTRLKTLLIEDLCDENLHWSIAYCLSWLRVSGANSVLAPWVYYQFPYVADLLRQLRDVPCSESSCTYCQTTHNPQHELKRYFGFDNFRYETPEQSLQKDIVTAGMCGKNIFAILPTGGGKSLCYQLPALNKYHRNGCLTVIVSPLQSLMKDQVDGLLAKNISGAACLNGLLSLAERADVLQKLQLGDIGLLLVSPEQFRNASFERAIKHRQIGTWVFDEAHCLSKWGNDFRPDYLYVSRFIREFSEGRTPAPIACFTATAKLEVLEDIQQHFKQRLDVDFTLFLGRNERDNLFYDVIPCQINEKFSRCHELLKTHLEQTEGGAVIFAATRKQCELLASYLQEQNWRCSFFHAGLEPNEKTDIQDSFISGDLQIIVATNAFGMGVDKQNIRLVIHIDIPGSLENYLQEAGRAGRDREDARCILLYCEHDVESQFRMNELSKVSLRDIQQILRKLRIESEKRADELVITAGEILQDDNLHMSFDAEDKMAETKVYTAIAWLEREAFLKRQANHTRIFPARTSLPLEKAEKRIESAELSENKKQEYLHLLRYLYQARMDERISTDELMRFTGVTAQEVVAMLRNLEVLGVLYNDTPMTLYLRHGIADSSMQRLQQSLAMEAALFELLSEQMPEANDGQWQDIHMPSLTSALAVKIERQDLLSLHVLRLLKSLSDDSDGKGQYRASFELRQLNIDYLKVRLKSYLSWRQISELGEKRRDLARLLLRHFVSKVAEKVRGKDLLVESTIGELTALLAADIVISVRIVPEQREAAINHVLLYLHRQAIVVLNHGMTVMRHAMIIETDKSNTKKFLKENYQALDEHYREKCLQVHVMREYAQLALEEMRQALNFVQSYFTQSKQRFLRQYFAGKEEILKLSTSEQSWREITYSLNTTQQQIVQDEIDQNCLVLAGPGSGKTRVIVHRIAYLLRVRHVPARSIIALTFNRHAAYEIRQRLYQLVGKQIYGVNIMTYHSMAMRLTATQFAKGEHVDEEKLNEVLQQAVQMLEGQKQIEGVDDLRDQLLRAYQYILVDEYQDIDDWQYRLVSALAGRQTEEEGKLCIIAVGDDDQNIYAWRGSSNKYIEHFTADYQAKIAYLVENYRSSKAIINASNEVISAHSQRLKALHPIIIDSVRTADAEGGLWQMRDIQRNGRVLKLLISGEVAQKNNLQAQAAMEEVTRLLALDSSQSWQNCAILARSHKYLYTVQAYCEQQGIPYFMAADKESVTLTRQREFVQLIDYLQQVNDESIALSTLSALIQCFTLAEYWHNFFIEAAEQLLLEFGEANLSIKALIQWLYDYAAQTRQQIKSGLFLGTVHSAKGLEFAHVVVLDGDWQEHEEAEQRLYYVGMTRAEQTLTLCMFSEQQGFHRTITSALVRMYTGRFMPALQKHYRILSLKEVDIDFAGRCEENDVIHQRIERLKIGERLFIEAQGKTFLLKDSLGVVVGKTAQAFSLQEKILCCEVAHIAVRYAQDSQMPYRERIRSKQWAVVLPRIIYVT